MFVQTVGIDGIDLLTDLKAIANRGASHEDAYGPRQFAPVPSGER